jgi:membrane protein DedA with SNARE-associated domain
MATGILFILGALLCNAVVLVFWIWILIDVVKYETDDENHRLIWVIIVAVVGPIGALVYLFVRRPKREATLGR